MLFDDSAGTAGGTTNVTINNGNVAPNAVTFNNNAYNYTISGSNGIANGSLLKNGTGMVTISAANTFAGGTTINNGTLQLGNGTANGALGNGAITVNAPGTLAINPNANGQTLTNALSGNGGLLKTGTNALTVSVVNSGFSGNTTISAGTLQVASASSLGTAGTISLGDANTGSNSPTFYLNDPSGSQNVSNPIVVNPIGGGTASIVVATTLNTFGGLVTFNGPVTLVNNAGDRNDFTGPITGSAGTVTVANGRFTFDETTANANTFTGTVVIDPNGTLQPNGVGALSPWNSIVANGDFYLNTPAGSTVAIDALDGTGVARVHPSVGQSISLQVGSNNGSGTFSGLITNGNSNAAALTFIKTGTGTQVISGTGSYSGATIVSNGLLQIGSATALPANTPLTIGSAGGSATLDMDGNNISLSKLALGSGAVAANQTITTSTGVATLTLGIASTGTTTVFNGQITQAAGAFTSLTVANSGTLVLGANNGYTGLTTLSGGTLYVNGQQSGPVSVAAGTRLGGSGKVGAITAAGSSQIEAGYVGAGALTANSLTFSDPARRAPRTFTLAAARPAALSPPTPAPTPPSFLAAP